MSLPTGCQQARNILSDVNILRRASQYIMCILKLFFSRRTT